MWLCRGRSRGWSVWQEEASAFRRPGRASPLVAADPTLGCVGPQRFTAARRERGPRADNVYKKTGRNVKSGSTRQGLTVGKCGWRYQACHKCEILCCVSSEKGEKLA